MKGMLRDHPKMRFGRASSWPLQWGGASDAYTQSPLGEQGTLKAVKFLPADRTGPDRLWITIEYRGRFFSGSLQIDDTGALPGLDAFLKSHVGEELSDIGDLEVDL
jgi:hypothetical protein